MVRTAFDALAPTWSERATQERESSVVDGLTRGRAQGGGLALEVGCGSGNHTSVIADHCDEVISLDLSFEMLRRVSTVPAGRLLCDASALPIRDSSIDLVVVVNMFVFPSEYRRVLRPTGHLLFVSSLGESTPIYLSPVDVALALGPEFVGLSSRAGSGIWSCFHLRETV
jgi:SAM-dependent methyltransferase